MTTIEQINRTERLLHAAKGSAQALKNRRWIEENYKNQESPLNTQIEQTEAQITEHRKALIDLYQSI